MFIVVIGNCLMKGGLLLIILNVFVKMVVLFGYKGYIYWCLIVKGGWWKLLNLLVM